MDELIDHVAEQASGIALKNATLQNLPKTVKIPLYDRSKLSPGIVHIGVGNFHRAHLAWYVHRLMQQGGAKDWGIIGAGVRQHDAAMRDRLLRQDCLTTLIELDPDGAQATEVTGAMLDYVPIESGNRALISAIADPRIRIVSTTVTESGYYLHPGTKELDHTHPDIQHDAENPQQPSTAFGAILAALKLRRDKQIGPLTCLSCDNLQENGSIFRQTVVGLARLYDQDLADWIDQNCAFPNSMVDCIVPATGPAELARAKSMGINDAAPVTHENFRQWVIEDKFCAGRPDWDLVGAEFSDLVHLHEAQKIRVLNGGHQILANVAEILGIKSIAGAMAHPLIHAMFRKIQTEEVLPHIKPLPNRSCRDYLDIIDRRFANRAIIDTVRRVAFDGSARHVGFILPSLRDGLESGQSIEGLALVEAAWARMCAGTREDDSLIDANDPLWDKLNKTAMIARQAPSAWLAMTEIYGALGTQERFSDSFEKWLTRLYQNGVEATIQDYLRSG